ncbi:MAG: hypothetical protein FWD25_09735, partial [Clostridia bacterium]|nr:hypothetical protein [Clostridia bacterium]
GFTGYSPVSGDLYFAQARYYNPDQGRFISKDPIIGLTFVPASLHNYNYVMNMPFRYTDQDGMFLHIVAGAVAGAVVGVAGQFVGDLVVSAISGEWNFSSWETYVGAGVGGAVGGAVTMVAGPVAGGAAAGAVSTFVGQGLEKATGKNDRSWGEIALNTAIGAGVGAACGWAAGKIPGPKIDGLTSGRGSYLHVYRTTLGRLNSGNIGSILNISGKTILKSCVAIFLTEGIGTIVMTPVQNLIILEWEKLYNIIWGGDGVSENDIAEMIHNNKIIYQDIFGMQYDNRYCVTA